MAWYCTSQTLNSSDLNSRSVIFLACAASAAIGKARNEKCVVWELELRLLELEYAKNFVCETATEFEMYLSRIA